MDVPVTSGLATASLFERLFESSPDGIVLTNRQGRIVRVNSQAESMFGYRREELLGQPVELLAPERFRSAHTSHREQYHAGPRMRPMGAGLALYGRRKDGTEFPVDIMLSPIETGEGLLVLGVIRDITERKRAEEALRESEERLRLLVEGVKDCAIFMLDPEGRVASWNPGAERIKGYSAAEIIGQDFSRFYTPEDVKRGKPGEELKIAAAAGRFEDEGWRVRKDGSRFWANVIVAPLRDGSGRLRGFAKVTRDFTERKRAQEAVLLEITSALVAQLDIRELLTAISASIRQVVAHDYAALAPHDADRKKLRMQPLTAPHESTSDLKDALLPLEGSPAGWVFTRREPLVLTEMTDPRFKIGRASCRERV